MTSRISCWLLLLSVAAGGAAAQSTYKSTMPDGKVIYGEKPAPGAVKVETIAAPPPAPGITIVTPAEKARVDKAAQQRSEKANAAQRELDAARKGLKEAEAALEAGKEPLPGERLGTVGGGSRLTDDYFERQKKLEQAVESARRRLEKAQQAAR